MEDDGKERENEEDRDEWHKCNMALILHRETERCYKISYSDD